MKTLAFLEKPMGRAHTAYQGSVFSPVSPEYSTGESILGAVYRTLLVPTSESSVDLKAINNLPSKLSGELNEAHWQRLLLNSGPLASPRLGGQLTSADLPQLMPLVPEIARHACVVGKKRNRWDPGMLFLTLLASGSEPPQFARLVTELQLALDVDDQDDLLARFLQGQFKLVGPQLIRPIIEFPSAAPYTLSGRNIPANRFVSDLAFLIDCKNQLTRRQWTVLTESLLRIGMGTHALWLTRLSERFWTLVSRATVGQVINPDDVTACWADNRPDPLLELGMDAVPLLRQHIRRYFTARLGMNLVLNLLEDAGVAWREKLGAGSGEPSKNLIRFLEHVRNNAAEIRKQLGRATSMSSVDGYTQLMADRASNLINGKKGASRNFFFFLRYTLGQLQPVEDTDRSYDQSYLLSKQNQRSDSPWPVRPGPGSLLTLTYLCCKSHKRANVSVEDFRLYLSDYGIAAPPGELHGGHIGTQLERLGLVMDSPDARGGRLLITPF